MRQVKLCAWVKTADDVDQLMASIQTLGKEVMKKGFFIFIVACVLVCMIFELSPASDLSFTAAGAAVEKEAKLYSCLEIPSAASLYGGYTGIYVTKRGYVASIEESLLDKAINLALYGSSSAFLNFISENQSVFFLKGDLMAEIEQKSWPGKVRIRLIDFNLSVWTVIEAVE